MDCSMWRQGLSIWQKKWDKAAVVTLSCSWNTTESCSCNSEHIIIPDYKDFDLEENQRTGGLGFNFVCVQRFLLPYDDIHDQEVSHQADDADNHVNDHDGDLHPRWQQGVGLVVGTAEVVWEERVIVELHVTKLRQQEVVRELHLWPRGDTVLHRPERSVFREGNQCVWN